MNSYLKKAFAANLSPIYDCLVSLYTCELLLPRLVYPQSVVNPAVGAQHTYSNFQLGPPPKLSTNLKGYLYSLEVTLPGLVSPH
jgi:hypothetical protein